MKMKKKIGFLMNRIVRKKEEQINAKEKGSKRARI